MATLTQSRPVSISKRAWMNARPLTVSDAGHRTGLRAALEVEIIIRGAARHERCRAVERKAIEFVDEQRLERVRERISPVDPLEPRLHRIERYKIAVVQDKRDHNDADENVCHINIFRYTANHSDEGCVAKRAAQQNNNEYSKVRTVAGRIETGHKVYQR